MSDAKAEIEITADTSRLPSALRQASEMVKGFASTAGGAVGSVGKAFLDVGKRAVGQMAGNLATRGLDFIVDQGAGVIDFERELTRFGIDLRKVPAEMGSIRDGIRRVSTETGIGAQKVLEAGRAYVDLAGATSFTQEKMELIARSAQASGADVGDMAKLMFTLTENMGVPNNELEDTIGGIINQAKDGTIRFRDLSKELVALAPVYKQFGVTGREGAIQLAGMMQIAGRGFGTASEAGTGVLRILRSLPQHASKFKAFGVNIFNPGSKNQLQNFLGIVQQIKKSGLSLDREALIKAFGRTEGERFYQLLKDSTAQYEKLIEAGKMNGVVNRDLGTYVDSSAGKIDKAMEKMKNAVAVAFTPERVAGFADALTRAAGAFMDAARWVDSHVGVSGQEANKQRAATIADSFVEKYGSGEIATDEARRLQNYKPGDKISPSVLGEIRDLASYRGDFEENVTALARQVGDLLANRYEEKGVKGAVSAGLMIRRDEEQAQGAAYLRTLGWTGGLGMTEGKGTPEQKVMEALGPAIAQALAPSLDAIARALGQSKVTKVELDNTGIAQAFHESRGWRRGK